MQATSVSAIRPFVRSRLVQAAAWLGCLTMLAGLVYFAYAGTFARFWADDYCYSAVVKVNGWLGGTWQWFLASGNRFSTITPVALSDLLGMQGVTLLPALVIGLWVLAWGFFLVQLTRLLGRRIPGLWLAFISLVFVFFSVLLAPDRLQTIYWRMGTLHYTLPAPLLLFNLAVIAWSLRRDARPAPWILIVTGLLALFTAGFSETFAALQAGLFFLALLAALVFFRGSRRTAWILSGLFPLLGTLAAMLIMLLSPSNAWRSAAAPPPDNLLLIIPYSLRYTLDFIFYTVRGQLVPFAVFVLAVITVAWLVLPELQPEVSLRFGILGAVTSLAVTYLLIVCSFAPSSYAGLQYPAGRALMPALFILLVGLSTCAFFTVLVLHQVISSPAFSWAGLAALLLLFGVSLYPLRSINIARQDVSTLSTWAQRWDTRDAQIRQQLTSGQADVQVREIEVVHTLEDIGPNAAFWINSCASIVYGAHSITANP